MATTAKQGGSAPPGVPAGADGGRAQKPPKHLRGRDRTRPRPPLGPVRRTIREIGFDLITAGIVVLLFVGYQLWGTGLAEANSQAQLRKQFGSTPTTLPAPSGDTATVGEPPPTTPSAPTGAAIAHLVIPKIGVDKYVVEGVAEADLRKGPGHYPGTPMPGEPGNSAVAGHRTTYGAPFYRVNELQSGDDIFVTTAAGRFRYVVAEIKTVNPTDLSVVKPTTDNRLTLTTCEPRFEATHRLIVIGKLTDLPAPPAARVAVPAPAVVAAAKVDPGAGDPTAWRPTLGYGLIFLVLWIAVRLLGARRRSWRWVPILAGIPICAVPLWFLFENVIRLAPSNI